jgi:hypothetical protein
MNREDIIRMAQEAQMPFYWRTGEITYLERFAALVASAERDRMCEQFNLSKELAHEKAKSNEAN